MSAGVWLQCTLAGTSPGSRITVTSAGDSWVRFLGDRFTLNDGNEYGYVGWGCDIIDATGGGSSGGGGGSSPHPTYFILGF